MRVKHELVEELADVLYIDLALAALDDLVQETVEDLKRYADVLCIEISSVHLLLRRQEENVLLEQMLASANLFEEAGQQFLGHL